MQALKAVVITLGVLIVMALGLLAWGVAVKFGGAGTEPEATATTPPSPDGPGAVPWRAAVPLPPGAAVTEVRAADGLLLFFHSGGADGDGVLLFNPRTGRWDGALFWPR